MPRKNREVPQVLLAVLVGGLLLGFVALGAQTKPVNLLADASLAGWVEEYHPELRKTIRAKPFSAFSLDQGVLHCDGSVGNTGFLRTRQTFCNFEVEAEFRAAAGANNGICFRAPPYDRETPAHTGFELQILLRTSDDPKGVNGALYSVQPPIESVVLPAGEWHTVRIRAEGSRIQAWMNGRLVQDFDQATHAETRNRPVCGHLFIQSHGGDTDFRKLEVRNLP